jgi:hypothetical protein
MSKIELFHQLLNEALVLTDRNSRRDVLKDEMQKSKEYLDWIKNLIMTTEGRLHEHC